MDRIAHRSTGADAAQLANALDPKRIHLGVGFGHEDNLDARKIGIHRNETFRESVVGVTRVATVDFGGFVQCRAYSPSHATHALAARGQA